MIESELVSRLKKAIRDIPDFPKPGIVFKDITPLLAEHATFKLALDALIESIPRRRVDKVVGIDARGFIFGAAVADRLGAGFVPLRKKGKLPHQTHEESYSLEYGEATIEVHKDAVHPGESVWLVDDLLATGGTAAAAVRLLNRLPCDLIAASFLIELSFLGGRAKLQDQTNVHAIVTY